MTGIYTYDEFVEAAKKAGLYDQFSQYDLDLARIHPEFGMSLLSYKLDYANAETDEERTVINAMANNLRKSYGNYTAGPYGSGYYLEPLSSVSQSETSAGISDLLGGLTNRTAFSYDPETDPDYASYRKQYLREGRRAVADTLGQAATATGGIPSSAAVTAASQAGDYYSGKLADKVPELSQQAYGRYLDQYNLDLAALTALQNQENTLYARDREQTEFDAAKAQQEFSNALALWSALGKADEYVSRIIGVPKGTPTSDQAYQDWYKSQ